MLRQLHESVVASQSLDYGMSQDVTNAGTAAATLEINERFEDLIDLIWPQNVGDNGESLTADDFSDSGCAFEHNPP